MTVNIFKVSLQVSNINSVIGEAMDKTVQKSVFQIWIWFGSHPYHLAGSGSTSGNMDLDPGSKKTLINAHKNQPKL